MQATETVDDGQDNRRRLDWFADFGWSSSGRSVELLHHQVTFEIATFPYLTDFIF